MATTEKQTKKKEETDIYILMKATGVASRLLLSLLTDTCTRLYYTPTHPDTHIVRPSSFLLYDLSLHTPSNPHVVRLVRFL